MKRELVSPYIAGNPLHTDKVFYGRDEIFERMRLMLRGESRDNSIFLYGQRRTGKTSILFQIKNQSRLDPRYLPVYINLHSMGITHHGISGLLYDIAGEICQATGNDRPKLVEFDEDTQGYFRYTFLRQVFNRTDNKHLLLLFDEYETLKERIERGELEKGILPFLRTLMADESSLSFIFAGNHKPNELGEDFTTAFGKTLLEAIKVGFLKVDEAVNLITKPVDKLIRYDDEAVKTILQLTSGHPFFIQLLCHNLFVHHASAMATLSDSDRVQITRKDVEDILDKTIANGENQLQEIWQYFSPKEKVVLTSVSAALNIVRDRETLVPTVRKANIDAELGRFNSKFEAGEVAQILKKLTDEKDILKRAPYSSRYRFSVDLLRRRINGSQDSSQYRFSVDLLRRWISSSQDLRECARQLSNASRGEKKPSRRIRPVWAIAPFVIAGLILAVLYGTVWLPPDRWVQLISGPTPTTAVATLPTSPSTPTLTHTPTMTSTPTEKPTGTSTPSKTPTHTPSSTSTPRPVQPKLIAPLNGNTYQNPITFKWEGSLRTGQTYRVEARHLDSNELVQSELLTTQGWTVYLPARFGEWRWQVSVVRNGVELVTSPEWMFWFVSSMGSGGPSNGPIHGP